MIVIKNFSQYINEMYQELPTDSSDMVRSKTELNNLSRWIREYQQKKNLVYTIYQTFTDDKDLLTKLKAQKLVDGFETDTANPNRVRNTNITDPKRMKFENPLLGEIAHIAEKKRMISDLDEDMKEQEKSISERERSTSKNERLRPSFQRDIDRMKEKISSIAKDIQELEKEIQILETKSREKFSQMQRELSLKQKMIADDIQDRKQTDIVDTTQK